MAQTGVLLLQDFNLPEEYLFYLNNHYYNVSCPQPDGVKYGDCFIYLQSNFADI